MNLFSFSLRVGWAYNWDQGHRASEYRFPHVQGSHVRVLSPLCACIRGGQISRQICVLSDLAERTIKCWACIFPYLDSRSPPRAALRWLTAWDFTGFDILHEGLRQEQREESRWHGIWWHEYHSSRRVSCGSEGEIRRKFFFSFPMFRERAVFSGQVYE